MIKNINQTEDRISTKQKYSKRVEKRKTEYMIFYQCKTLFKEVIEI